MLRALCLVSGSCVTDFRVLPSHPQSSPLGLKPVTSPASIPLSSSPSNPPSGLNNPDIYRVLNEVVPLEDCEVYSWIPEPEYNPLIDVVDGELSEDEFMLDDTLEEEEEPPRPSGMEVDTEIDPAWGSQGMELDDVPPSAPMDRPRTSSGVKRRDTERIADLRVQDASGGRPAQPDGDRRNAGLLWSKNYFFYSR